MAMMKQKIDHQSPSEEIKKILKLRGITIKKLAQTIGAGYFVVQKTINNTPVRRVDGSFGFYKVPHVKEAIADFLKIPFEHLWGPDAKEALRLIIERESEGLVTVRGQCGKCGGTYTAMFRIPGFIATTPPPIISAPPLLEKLKRFIRNIIRHVKD